MDERERGEEEEEEEIVIIGGGICGLATALALHRKGIRSLVLERWEELRASGAAIGVQANGWRALSQLGVADRLRQTALPLLGARDIWLGTGTNKEIPLVTNESRCLKRSELINALADALPPSTIRFGCEVVSIDLHPSTSYPVLHLQDGKSIVAKVLIGCDGARSVVAQFLKLKPTREFALSAVRGLTDYPNGHTFPHEFVRLRRNNILIGRIPIDKVSVYWFVALETASKDVKVSQDPELIKQLTLQSINGFPEETIQMVETSDLETVSFTRLRYRPPWDLLTGSFRRGTVTVAGDAMHVMGPFLGQGGSAGLEDAVVLARCLSQKLRMMKHNVGEAMDQYVRERRMRVVRLSTQTYLTGLLLQSSSTVMKVILVVVLALLFSDQTKHARYDCGQL